MWYLIAMEIRVMLFLLVQFFMIYSTGQINYLKEIAGPVFIRYTPLNC